jgi:hypothetical protein
MLVWSQAGVNEGLRVGLSINLTPLNPPLLPKERGRKEEEGFALLDTRMARRKA